MCSSRTYPTGRFYEPFYLVFAQESQLLRDTARTVSEFDKDAAERLDEGQRQESSKLNPGVRLRSHTIPQFVPLQDLLKHYLKPESPRGDGDEDETHIRGGFELLNVLMHRESLEVSLLVASR